jgi:predicted ester cyclase
MSTDESKAIVRRWREEIWNKRNLNIIDELHAPDYVGHYSGVVPEPIRGREALKQLFAAYFAALDIHVETQFLIAEGNMVVVHDTNRVKHTGTFRGISPTGKEVSVTSTDIYRVADGKIAEQWLEGDITAALQQLGVLPTSAPGAGTP